MKNKSILILYMFKSGYSVLLLTIIISAIGVTLSLSALSTSTQVAKTNINVTDTANNTSKARSCTEKVFTKLRAQSFYGGDETLPDEECRIFTITKSGNGSRIVHVKSGDIVLETKITQIAPKLVIEYQKIVPSSNLGLTNPYLIDPLALRLWLKADRAESNNNQPVISLNNATDDLISFGQIPTSPNLAPTLITNAINNLPALRFDGVDDFLTGSTSSIGNTTGLTVVVVGKSNLVSPNQTYIAKFDPSANKREWRLQNGSLIVTDVATAEQVNETVSFNPPNTDLRIITARWAPSTPASININNGGINNAIASFTDITSTDTPIIIGAQQAGGNGFFSGDIAEILVYQKRLSDTELSSINTYFNTKYTIY